MADVAGYAESRRRLFNLDPRLASTAPLVAGPKGEKPESADEDVQEKGEHGDVRTLWVDYDEGMFAQNHSLQRLIQSPLKAHDALLAPDQTH